MEILKLLDEFIPRKSMDICNDTPSLTLPLQGGGNFSPLLTGRGQGEGKIEPSRELNAAAILETIAAHISPNPEE